MKKIEHEYNYNNVYLVPNKCIVESRSLCDTSIEFGGRKFILPIVPSNMPSVVNETTCKFLCRNGLFYVMHRFGVDNVKFIDMMQRQNDIASISIGVNQDSYDELKRIKAAKLIPEYILIDIAYAYSIKMENMLKYAKDMFPESFIWCGNVTTPEGVDFVTTHGANACKLFVGPGAVCSTTMCTGFTRGCISTILECTEMSKIPLVPDGGIRQIGDISKALCALGTPSMIMAGSLFAGFEQSAGKVIKETHGKYKEYYGNASSYVSNDKNSHIEGKRILIEYKDSMVPFIKHIKESLQSSISYAGGTDLSALANCKMICINN